MAESPLAALFAKRTAQVIPESIAPAPSETLAKFSFTPKVRDHDSAPRPIPQIKPLAINFAAIRELARKASTVKEETQANTVQDDDSYYNADDYDSLRAEYSPPDIDLSQFNILDGVTITLDPSQEAACFGLAVERSGCLIGAAGTGKTTTTRYLLNTLINGAAHMNIPPLTLQGVNITAYHEKTGQDDEQDDDESEEEYEKRNQGKHMIPAVALVAFTGQATQVLKRNMPKSWRMNVMTIHSLLGYHPVNFDRGDGSEGMRFEPYYTKSNRMPWKAIFIDEASMVNVDLWHQLRDAAHDDCRFYFIGDLNQLTPPIGQGILGFALAKLPTFELTVVHRQKDEAANRIVDTAWRVLQGQPPVFDDPTTNPNWRVIGFKLNDKSQPAHGEVINIARTLAGRKISASVDPAEPVIYDPWRDRIMTPMNGYSPEDPASLLGQYPINEALAQIFADPTQPRIIINAKKSIKKFAVGYRVMATKNEPPDMQDRVTNGLTGKIISIEDNSKWTGDWRLVGTEDEVAINRKEMLEVAMNQKGKTEVDVSGLGSFSFTPTLGAEKETEEKQGGPASHIVGIHFDNGATRFYALNAQIDQLQIAYASTTHKAQGAEMPTAIIIVHQASKRMLCRENLYTAITRASQRVVILYTDLGMRLALNTQKIFGSTLAEKITMYRRFMGESEDSGGFKFMNVRLYADDPY